MGSIPTANESRTAAASSRQVIYSKGIYHGLPDLSDKANGLTAIVTGSNGISGSYMMKTLCESPQRWTKIYSFSRRPPAGKLPPQVEHIPLDFTKTAEEIAAVMRENQVKADYVFFFSYILLKKNGKQTPWGDPDFVKVNDQILRNFVEALPLAEALPKRIFVQTGGKYYGVHLGPPMVPQEEEDPRIDEPNLYYNHEDILRDLCRAHPSVGYNIGLPSFILCATPMSVQTIVWPIAVYASVQRHLGLPLEWPSDIVAWEATQSISTAALNSYLFEWAVLTDQAKNQSFNATDDSAFTWGKFWPRIARFYGIEYTRPDSNDNAKWNIRELPKNPPPRGFGPPGRNRSKWSFVDWAVRPEVTRAWREIIQNHGLLETDLAEDVESVFGRADFGLHRSHSSMMSQTKAKKMGFFGFVDSNEAMFSTIQDFVDLKMLPPP